MSTDLLEKNEVQNSNTPNKTDSYRKAYEPELLQKEIDCCTAATD